MYLICCKDKGYKLEWLKYGKRKIRDILGQEYLTCYELFLSVIE
jgi:hypothetical protein